MLFFPYLSCLLKRRNFWSRWNQTIHFLWFLWIASLLCWSVNTSSLPPFTKKGLRGMQRTWIRSRWTKLGDTITEWSAVVKEILKFLNLLCLLENKERWWGENSPILIDSLPKCPWLPGEWARSPGLKCGRQGPMICVITTESQGAHYPETGIKSKARHSNMGWGCSKQLIKVLCQTPVSGDSDTPTLVTSKVRGTHMVSLQFQYFNI